MCTVFRTSNSTCTYSFHFVLHFTLTHLLDFVTLDVKQAKMNNSLSEL